MAQSLTGPVYAYWVLPHFARHGTSRRNLIFEKENVLVFGRAAEGEIHLFPPISGEPNMPMQPLIPDRT